MAMVIMWAIIAVITIVRVKEVARVEVSPLVR